MTKMNWSNPYGESDPARYQPPVVTALILPDDHEARIERQRKKAKKATKKTKAAKRKAEARADARGWKSAGGGVMKRTVKSPSGRKTGR